jgi:hypothetical protein
LANLTVSAEPEKAGSKQAICGQRVAVGVIAIILLLASVGKAVGFFYQPVGSRFLTLIQVEAEWLLGLWLISGLATAIAVRVATITYLSFAGYALFLGLGGAKSCGCFGPLIISPWVIFGFDLVCAGALALMSRSARQFPARGFHRWGIICVGTYLAGGTVLVALVVAAPTGGLSASAKEVLASRPIAQIPPATAVSDLEKLVCDLGYVDKGSSHELQFFVSNPTDGAIAIDRIEPECHCTTIIDPPKSLAPKALTRVSATFVAPQESIVYQKSIVLLTTDRKIPSKILTIRARVGLPLSWQPAIVEVEQAKVGEVNSIEISVVNGASQPVKLLFASADNPDCLLRIPNNCVAQTGMRPLELKIKPTRAGEQSATLTIHTDSTDQRLLEVPVRWIANP